MVPVKSYILSKLKFSLFIIFFSNYILFSCSESEEIVRINETLIENFDQFQQTTFAEKYKGDQAINEIHYENKNYSRNGYHQMVIEKYNVAYDQAKKIDKSSKEIIQLIEGIKLQLLESEDEDITTISKEKSIILEKFNRSNIETIIPLNLRNVKNKNSSEAVNEILISTTENKHSVTGKKLWNALLNYRKRIVTDLACYQYGPEKYYLSFKDFNSNESKKKISKKIELWLKNSKINRDDEQVIKDIYTSLLFSSINNENWIDYSFKDVPITQAITNLTLLETKILIARNNAFEHLNIRLFHCCYKFTNIAPITSGPSLIKQGDDVEIKVMFAAYDEDEVPKVEVYNKNSSVKENFGYSIVKVRNVEKSGIQIIKGKIYVQNNSGEIKTKDWEWKVNVIPRK